MGRHEDFEQARAAATGICRTLRGAGHTAYFAGGCVRDELLGLEPTDYDVATDAPPDRIRSLFDRTAEVGAAFGVMLVRERGVTIEVATFREESGYSDKRRPDEVRFSTAERDARRRDYTVNALFLDPIARDEQDAGGVGTIHGHVIDLVGGMDDLHARVIRAVGDPNARLAEDHLRALRAVRLAARLGFRIEPATAGAIREHASELSGVSRERIGDEIRRIMSHESRARAATLLGELGLDRPVLGDSWPSACVELLSRMDEPDVPAALAAWAIDRGLELAEPAIDTVVSHWREALMLSNDERAAMRDTLLGVRALRDEWAAMGVASRKRLAGAPRFGPALGVLDAIDPGAARNVREAVDALARTPSGLSPAPLVTGDDLVAIGYRPGPGFKTLLDAVYDAQLDDRIASRDEAMAFVQREAETHGVSKS